ncbi:(d)CMP kinase [soil metagenome]
MNDEKPRRPSQPTSQPTLPPLQQPSLPLVVTIDGPAASGKSSVARAVADALQVPFVSSGLLYRAATLLVLEADVDPSGEAEVLALLNASKVTLQALPIEPNRVLVGGEDVSAALHTDDVDENVSAVAKHPRVRDWVRERLRDVAGSFVIEGRDMGSVVFPGASHKFYLTAPVSVRATRRVGERAAGLADVAAALQRRDTLDAAQLEPAPDALLVETGHLSLEGVVEHILQTVQAHRAD